VYTPVPESAGHFKRLEVVTGNMLPGNLQEVVSGIKSGDRVVSNALVMQNTLEQSWEQSMIRRVVDFALNNRLLVLGFALLLFAGASLLSMIFPLRPIPT